MGLCLLVRICHRGAVNSQRMYLALAGHSRVASFGLPKAQAATMMMGITANHSINHLAVCKNPVMKTGSGDFLKSRRRHHHSRWSFLMLSAADVLTKLKILATTSTDNPAKTFGRA